MQSPNEVASYGWNYYQARIVSKCEPRSPLPELLAAGSRYQLASEEPGSSGFRYKGACHANGWIICAICVARYMYFPLRTSVSRQRHSSDRARPLKWGQPQPCSCTTNSSCRGRRVYRAVQIDITDLRNHDPLSFTDYAQIFPEREGRDITRG